MPQKIGGGGRPQPYEKSDGRYIDGVGKSQEMWMPKMVKGGLYDGAGSEEDVERIKLSKEEKKKLVQDIMSFKPIELQIGNGKIRAEFDKFSVRKNIYDVGRSDVLGYNFKISNIKNIPDFIKSSKYDKSKLEKGKGTAQHKDVCNWHYFVNEIKDKEKVFDMVVNIRDKGAKQYFYEIFFTEKNKV